MSATRKTAKLVRQLIVLAIGLPIVILGIVLVPLPGPGILLMLIGLFILSLEFDWAKKYVDQIKSKFKAILSASQDRANKLRDDK